MSPPLGRLFRLVPSPPRPLCPRSRLQRPMPLRLRRWSRLRQQPRPKAALLFRWPPSLVSSHRSRWSRSAHSASRARKGRLVLPHTHDSGIVALWQSRVHAHAPSPPSSQLPHGHTIPLEVMSSLPRCFLRLPSARPLSLRRPFSLSTSPDAGTPYAVRIAAAWQGKPAEPEEPARKRRRPTPAALRPGSPIGVYRDDLVASLAPTRHMGVRSRLRRCTVLGDSESRRTRSLPLSSRTGAYVRSPSRLHAPRSLAGRGFRRRRWRGRLGRARRRSEHLCDLADDACPRAGLATRHFSWGITR
jgi:hypothetical protein